MPNKKPPSNVRPRFGRDECRHGTIAIFCILSLLYLFWMSTPTDKFQMQYADDLAMPRPNAKFSYRTIPSFSQALPETDFATFNFTSHHFGLVERSWPAFHAHVANFSSTLPANERVKVLFIARHGQGVHNVAEALYGTPAWEAKWARLPGDGKLQWEDAALTAEGRAQAERAGSFWLSEVKEEGLRLLEGGYVSPLARCLETARLIYGTSGVYDGIEDGFRPVVKESLRETMGVHTCDKRSSRSWIHRNYPEYEIEESLTEEDELWDPNHRETEEEMDERLGGLLDEIFAGDDRVWLGLTCHSGASGALLRVLGHRVWRRRPGEILPVFVEATRIS